MNKKFNFVHKDEKRDFIYKEADFILENENLFKNGTFKLIHKDKKLSVHKIHLKDYCYSIIKKEKRKNIEQLKKNLSKQPLKFNSLMSFHLKNMKYNPKINTDYIKQDEIENTNFSNYQTTKTSFENYRTQNNSKKHISEDISSIKFSKNLSETTLLDNKINSIKNKKNDKKNLISLPSPKNNKNIISNSSMRDVEKIKKLKITIPSELNICLKKKPIYNSYRDQNIKYTTQNLINNLKRTQLNSIIKYRNKLIKDKKSISYNFKNTVTNYFKSHQHKNYFSLSPEVNDNRLVKILNKYQKSIKSLPKFKNVINQIQLIEEENEKRKILISEHLYCISENLEKMNKSFTQIENNTISNSFDFKKKRENKNRINDLRIKYKNYIKKKKEKKSDLEIVLTDIEKKNKCLNYELKIWKKI